MSRITGQHTHPTLGDFDYAADLVTKKAATTWFVDWTAVATGAGRVLELAGGSTEIIQGGPGAAEPVIRNQIGQQIDMLK